MKPYPGSSTSKNVALVWLYGQFLRATRAGHFVGLCGTTPEVEVSLARDVLKWPAKSATFVDWARNRDTRAQTLSALSRVEQMWPGARGLNAEVGLFIEVELAAIGVANLDFCGFSQPAAQAVDLALPRLIVGGMLGLTWLGSRESRGSLARRVWERGEGDRVRGMELTMRDMAHGHGIEVEMIGHHQYRHNHSDMVVGAWRRVA